MSPRALGDARPSGPGSSDLYSVKEAATIVALEEARLRYWAQTGFVGPSVRRGGRMYYTFRDLVAVKVAKELLEGGLSLQHVRKNLNALRTQLPSGDPATDQPLARLRVCSDGESLVVVGDELAYQPASGQLVMSFAVDALSSRAAEVHALPAPADAPATDGADGADGSAYASFLAGVAAAVSGDDRAAEAGFRRALAADPALAAAHTNIGNLLHARGDLAGARAAYERALELEPEQPEARFNLGNVLDDLGETELALAELRRVVAQCPEFADAHFNLGVTLARVGGVAQAREHLSRYLELDPESRWAEQARAFVVWLAGEA